MAQNVQGKPAETVNDSRAIDGRSRRVPKDPGVQMNVKVSAEVDEMIWDLVERLGVPKKVLVEAAIRDYHRAAAKAKSKQSPIK